MFATPVRVPSRLNNRVMPAVGVAVLLLAVLAGPATAQPPHRIVTIDYGFLVKVVAAQHATQQFRTQLLNLINQHRASNGRKALVWDNALNTGAQAHSNWMQSTGKFQHPQNIGCRSENIYWSSGPCNPNACFNAWKNSAPHNKNMLDPYVSKIGIGVNGGYATARFQ